MATLEVSIYFLHFGDMHPVDFVSFEGTEADFEADWMALRR